MPVTMKAIRYDRYGPPEVLTLQDVAKPTAAAGQVLVRVRAASVNPIDWKLRAGDMKNMLPLDLPQGAGQDLAGEVVEVGGGVSGLRTGDAVYAMIPNTEARAYAEFVALDRAAVGRKPASLDFIQAAATPMGALTSWQAIVEVGGLKAGDRLFVHGAGGNVGGWAVRLARALGAHVTAAASANSRDQVLGYGADDFVDYDAGPFQEAAGDMDVVLDTLAGEIQARSWGMIKPGGILVTTLAVGDDGPAKSRGVRAERVQAHPDGAELDRIAGMIDGGKLAPLIGRVMKLEQAAEAQRTGQAGEAKGKIVLTVD